MAIAENPQLTADLWWSEAKKIRGTQGTGENEWYTPARYIELVRSVRRASTPDLALILTSVGTPKRFKDGAP